MVPIGVDLELTAVVVALERDEVGEGPNSAALVLPVDKEGSQYKVREVIMQVPLTKSPR